jgi:hypothetical protein
VTRTRLDDYWQRHYWTSRRVLGPSKVPDTLASQLVAYRYPDSTGRTSDRPVLTNRDQKGQDADPLPPDDDERSGSRLDPTRLPFPLARIRTCSAARAGERAPSATRPSPPPTRPSEWAGRRGILNVKRRSISRFLSAISAITQELPSHDFFRLITWLAPRARPAARGHRRVVPGPDWRVGRALLCVRHRSISTVARDYVPQRGHLRPVA